MGVAVSLIGPRYRDTIIRRTPTFPGRLTLGDMWYCEGGWVSNSPDLLDYGVAIDEAREWTT